MTAPNDQPDAEAPESAPPGGIGASLRTERMALGRDIAFVAEHLRIRAAYIRAIEEGRFTELPGSTYAIGFVRSYAEFLGLEPEEVVRRFKQETADDLAAKPELFFPSPVSEGRIPGGAVLFLGLVLAATAYGSWYYMSSREISIAELVPALPERLATMIGVEPAAAPAPDGETAETQDATETAESEPAQVDATPAPTETAMPAAPVAATTPGPATPVPATTPAPVAPAATTPVATTPVTAAVTPPAKPPAAEPTVTAAVTPPAPAPATPPAPAPEPAAAAPEPAPAPPPAAPDMAADSEAPAAEQTASSTAQPPPGDGGKIYGAHNVNSRITLRAFDDAWIQVRDQEEPIHTRLLRKGDVYRVPDKSGLTLMTGSAGGLEILVDGRAAPSLGPIGAVRRDIVLDPEKLLAGQ